MSEGLSHPARSIALAFACVGLALSAAANVASYLGQSWHKGLFVLHFGILILGFGLVFSHGGRRVRLQVALSRWPWTRYLPVLAMVYAGVTFGATIVLSDGGMPQERDGRLVLASRGRFIRELTPEEFRWHEALDSRLWTAAWMCFYLCFALHLAGAPEAASSNSTPQEG
jgi:hypothetical protein